MGICKKAVNWKYLEIYQEFKHILKGHLCTRSNQNQQYYHTGAFDNTADGQLVSIMLHSQYMFQLYNTIASPSCIVMKGTDIKQ